MLPKQPYQNTKSLNYMAKIGFQVETLVLQSRLHFFQHFVFQFSNRAKYWTTPQPPLPIPTHNILLEKLYFAHHTLKQVLLESDGSPPNIFNN